jgi:NadR type nicotinamide-nucleotide adenylyltransferase
MKRKIAIVGPESTGKTTLCRQLAEWFDGEWIPEAAREYISACRKPYTKEDVENIARQQIELEEGMEKSLNPWLFCDTNLLVIKIWMEDVFGNCPDWILQESDKRTYDLQLLMKPDLEWEPDPIRENPDRQEYFYTLYQNELQKSGVLWAEISGTGDARLQLAVGAIQHHFQFEPEAMPEKPLHSNPG